MVGTRQNKKKEKHIGGQPIKKKKGKNIMKQLEQLEKLVLTTEQICYLLTDEGYEPTTELQVDPLRINVDITDNLYVVNYETIIEVFQAHDDEDFQLIQTLDKTKVTPKDVIKIILALITK